MRSAVRPSLAPLLALVALVASAVPAGAQLPSGTTLLLGRPSGDALPSGLASFSDGATHAVSADGRYVVFASDSDGLLPAGVHSRWSQIFRLDRTTGTIAWLSHTPGGQPGNETSTDPSISGDGSKVAYYSQANNLVAGDANGYADIHVWDAATDTNTIVSRPNGSTVAQSHGFNTGSTISRNGTYVVWESEATDLVGGGLDPSTERSVYRRNLVTNATILISRADGVAGASAASSAYAAAPSANGDLVAFTTATDGLDPSAVDTGGRADVFVRRVSTGDTFLVSRQEVGGTDPPSTNGQAGGSSFSDDGLSLVFDSTSTDLVPGDGNARRDVFQRALPTAGGAGVTSLVSRNAAGTAPGDGNSFDPEISADGARVAFATDATDVVPGDTNGLTDVVMRDGAGNHVLSRRPDGTPAGMVVYGYGISLDATGAFAAFGGGFPDITDLDDDGFTQIYGAETTTAAPVVQLSRPPGLSGPFIGGLADATAQAGAISRNGRYVAILSAASAFPGGRPGGPPQAYVRDVRAGTLELVSRAADGTPADAPVFGAKLSADGRYVAFVTGAINLDPADGSRNASVYRFDRVTGTTALVSRASGGGPDADDDASLVGISADGSRVAFTSGATNLGAGEDAASDLFVRDMVTGATILASRADGPAGADADQSVGGSALSGDGRVVAFSTNATNLGGGGPGADVYVRDLTAGTTVLGARADGAGGAPPDASATSPALDGDGSVLAFSTQATNFGVAPGPYPQTWVRDLAAGTTRLVTKDDGPGGAVAVGVSLSSALSADGSRIAFSDSDGSLTGEAPASQPQAYVRDLATDALRLVSRADGAGGGPQVSEFPSIGSVGLSADGHCATFSSSAPGLASVDYAVRDFTMPYLRVVDGTCAGDPDLPAVAPPAGGGTTPAQPAADRTAPVVGRFRATRRTFAVGARPTAVSARRRTPRGTTLSWSLSEAATVRIAVARQLSGRRVGKRCVRPTRRLRRAKRCVRLGRARTLTRRAPAGTAKLAFSGRIGRTPLARGRYTLTLVATDAAGNRSAPRRLTIRIVRP